ncbi:MAG: SCP2 sterol-binding domain-containing protein [Acidobacteriota bacterium]
MAHTFGTADWATALMDELNGSSEYASAAKGWGVGFDGSILLSFEADGRLREPVYVLLRLEGGKCQGVELAKGPATKAGFGLRGPFDLWKRILERKMLAATAIFMGKLKLDGDKVTLFKHTAAHRALIACTAAVDTIYP